MKTQILMTALAVAVAGTASAQRGIGVRVDGEPVRFMGAQPRMVNGSVLVPLRGVFEQMGAQVLWDQSQRQVTAIKGKKTIRLNIGERFADVDGRSVRLNTPAQVVGGSTLVPLRFLSESLGANVTWDQNDMMVLVQSSGSGRAQPIRDRNDRNDRETRRDAIAVLYKSTVIPVKLEDELSSNESRAGDRFTATLDATNGVYGNLPAGTKIEGRVVSAKRQQGEDPGLLELAFDRLVMPNGDVTELDGSLINLDDKGIKREDDGRLVATGKAKDNRGVYAGYGAGAGLIVGLLSKKPIESTIIGGLLGFGLGSLEKPQQKPSNVKLDKGTKFGVRLDSDATVYRDR